MKSSQYKISLRSFFSGTALTYADIRTGKQTDVTPNTGDFPEYSNAPETSFAFLEKRAVFISAV